MAPDLSAQPDRHAVGRSSRLHRRHHAATDCLRLHAHLSAKAAGKSGVKLQVPDELLRSRAAAYGFASRAFRSPWRLDRTAGSPSREIASRIASAEEWEPIRERA